MDKYDFIIVGAGSAGCVLANRLSENGKYSVLLLEAGGSDKRFWIQIPIGYGKTYYQKAVNWMYLTEPVPGLNQRQSYWPRGKVLGGSSSINAMVWVRGNAKDYDDWAAAGNSGWSYADVLPYFKRCETFIQGDPQYRGHSGPIQVQVPAQDVHPLCQDFIRAGVELGEVRNPDMNGASQEGVGLFQLNTHNGMRMSAAKAYLHPALKRSNLRLIDHALVTKVIFAGTRALGVEYERHGQRQQVFAKREVILSGGAVNSPQLLQLSGVGAEEVLKPLGIAQVANLPAVGRHLQDHLGMDYLYTSRQPTLNDELHPWWGKLWAGIKYVFKRRGPLSLSVNQAGGFIKTRPELAQPDIQLYFSPVSYTRAPAGKRPLMNPDPFSGFLLGLSNCRVKSEGYIQIKSSDPRQPPLIQPNYLSNEEDVQTLLAGVKYLRKLAQTQAMSGVIIEEIRPGPACVSDEQLIEDIHAYAWTVFHPCSTCRMGPSAEDSVVDARLRVHGIQGLRVCDASAFPSLVSGNTNAPTIMLAERGADLILADHRH